MTFSVCSAVKHRRDLPLDNPLSVACYLSASRATGENAVRCFAFPLWTLTEGAITCTGSHARRQVTHTQTHVYSPQFVYCVVPLLRTYMKEG